MDTIMGLNPTGDNDPQYVLLEQHCYLELPAPFNDEEAEGVEEPRWQRLRLREQEIKMQLEVRDHLRQQ